MCVFGARRCACFSILRLRRVATRFLTINILIHEYTDYSNPSPEHFWGYASPAIPEISVK